MRLAGLGDKDQAIFPAPPRGPAIVARLADQGHEIYRLIGENGPRRS
jgi:hypothetical protein